MDPRPDTPSDRTDDSDSPDAGLERHPVSAAERIIDLFGGIRPMAHKLNVPVTTVQGWKKRGAIPESRHDEILQAAEQHDLTIDPADLAAAAPRTPGAEDLPEGTGEEAAGIQDARRGPEPETAAAEAREEPGPTPAEPEEAEVPEKAEEPEKKTKKIKVKSK